MDNFSFNLIIIARLTADDFALPQKPKRFTLFWKKLCALKIA